MSLANTETLQKKLFRVRRFFFLPASLNMSNLLNRWFSFKGCYSHPTATPHYRQKIQTISKCRYVSMIGFFLYYSRQQLSELIRSQLFRFNMVNLATMWYCQWHDMIPMYVFSQLFICISPMLLGKDFKYTYLNIVQTQLSNVSFFQLGS